MDELPIKKDLVLDLLPTNAPALSSTSDMPIIETKPDAIDATTVPVAEAATPEKAVETPVESATTATEEQSGADGEEVKKPPRGVQKRLDELTRQREDAERRAERLLAIVEGMKQQPEAQAPPELVRPSRDDYSDQAQYEDAFMAFAVENAKLSAKTEVESMTKAAKEQAARIDMEARNRVVQEAYAQRVVATKAKYADFSEVAESPEVQIPIAVVHAIVQAEDGPELQYYFGKNPDEAKRLLALPPPIQLVELGKISMKLASPTAPKPVLSNAPPPPKALKPGPAEVPIDPSTESMEAYVSRRKKELAVSARH